MHILHCIATMAQGGAERQVAQLTNSLTARGHEVTIALLREGVMLDRLESPPRIERIRAAGNRDPRIVLRIARLIRRIRPDVVHTWLPQMDILGGMAALITRTPWILSERSSHLAYRGLQGRFRVRVGRYADAIVANSSIGLRYWEERSPRARVRRVIPNAASAGEADDSVPDVLAGAAGRRLVVYVGRFSAEKNLGRLMAAFERVLAEENAVAVLCGVGPLEATLRTDVAARGLSERVIFAGYVTDVASILRRADAFVLISTYEGQPNAVIEAILCGCPVVLSDIPAHRELLADDAALFVDGSDVTSIAEALRSTLHDRELARERAARAAQRASMFTPARVADEYERVYREAAGQRP